MIPVVDLFAGPGGLGEGFSALRTSDDERVYKIVISIEMNSYAHATLRLRSFFRQFEKRDVPEEYYDFLRGKISVDVLFEKYPDQAEAANRESWRAELGNEREFPALDIDKRISESLRNTPMWVLIGGPPCQAYSLAGRARMIPVDRAKYETDHRHFLYREYLRIIAVHRPPVFVMENVKGILSSKVKGASIIDRIIHDLQQPYSAIRNAPSNVEELSYDLYALANYGTGQLFGSGDRSPSDYIIRCELYGIPQARHRVILLGVRKDLGWQPMPLKLVTQQVPMWAVVKDLPPIRSRLSQGEDISDRWQAAVREIFRNEAIKNGYLERGLRALIRDTAAQLYRFNKTGAEFISWAKKPSWFRTWFYDPRLKGVCNHVARSHRIDDLWRYFFAACFAEYYGTSPRLPDFPPELLPAHKNVDPLDYMEGVDFADRFRVQVKHQPATTITSHIAKDGHFFIHPDPRQCRSLTVREAARLQTFPDNYFFMGGRTEQYRQIGNAVPPLLARKIAHAVHDMYLRSICMPADAGALKG